jgi:DNA polymerase III delta subunit
MITTLAGKNSFAMRQKLRDIVNEFQQQHGELAIEKFDAEEAEADSIIEALQALSFLSAGKMVVIRGGAANKAFAERIEQTISSIPGTTDVIFYEPQLDKRTAYFKVLNKQTKFEEFYDLDRPALARWLVEEAKELNAKLSPADAAYMVERLGENQNLLYNQLDKLAIYDSNISRSNIEFLTEPTPQSQVFDLLDAAFGGQKQKALRLYEDQRAQKVEPQIILGMIGWQLRLLALIKLARGKTTAQIAKDAGMKPYPVEKASRLAVKLRDENLRRLTDEALEIDIKGKTTALDLDEALKNYIITL